MFTVRLAKQPQKFLKKSEKELHDRLCQKLKDLAQNPFPTDVKRVVGKEEKVFRVRVGDYRIQYEVIYAENLVMVTEIEKRPRTYD